MSKSARKSIPETVVCIIEAMKVMNEIKAEVKGVITQVLVENAKPVEFGQPLFKVRPSLTRSECAVEAGPLTLNASTANACLKKFWSPTAGKLPSASSAPARN